MYIKIAFFLIFILFKKQNNNFLNVFNKKAIPTLLDEWLLD